MNRKSESPTLCTVYHTPPRHLPRNEYPGTCCRCSATRVNVLAGLPSAVAYCRGVADTSFSFPSLVLAIFQASPLPLSRLYRYGPTSPTRRNSGAHAQSGTWSCRRPDAAVLADAQRSSNHRWCTVKFHRCTQCHAKSDECTHVRFSHIPLAVLRISPSPRPFMLIWNTIQDWTAKCLTRLL